MSAESPLCTKLLEIIPHMYIKPAADDEVNLKCDMCKNNAVIVLCISCTQCLCKACYKDHSEENNEHNILTLDKESFCPEHRKGYEYYCEKCDEFACSGCKVKHSSGDNHSLDVIEEVASKRRQLLAKVAVPAVDESNQTLFQTEAKLTTAQKNLKEQFAEVGQNIDEQYETQFRKLKENHDQLKKKLSDVMAQREKVLVAHLEEIKSTQNEVMRVRKLLDDLKTTPHQKVISMKEQMEFRVQKITNQCKNLSSQPMESDLITFDPITEPAEILGELRINVNVRDLPKRVTKDKIVEFSILTKDQRKTGEDMLFIKFTSPTGNITAGNVRDNDDGSYTVSIKPEEIGEAKLSVYIDGMEIKGSPFTFDVVGIPCNDARYEIVDVNYDGKMGKLWGIAISKLQSYMWAVSDITNHCVYIFDNQNQVLHEFGRKGSKKGEFNQPFGLAFDSHDHLYVVDGGNDRVQKFETDGTYLLEFGTKGSGDGELSGPFGITTHCDKVYVADFHNKRISVFQTDGEFLNAFGSDHLAGPRDVAVSASNKLLVADYNNHKIYTFSLDGNLESQFGKKGNCKGELNFPLSIAIWNEDILISDENHCVSIFSEDGRFVRCSGCGQGAAKGQLNYPYGVASRSNSIYVADLLNQRVQIFKLQMVNVE